MHYSQPNSKGICITWKSLLFYGSGERASKYLTLTGEASWAVSKAIIAVVVDKRLEILHMAEEAWGFDHLQPLLHGRLSCHFH